MIPTRLHGVIDYSVALLFGGLSRSRSLSGPVRDVLGSAAVYHTSYSLLTDYEAGIRPDLTMRQHLTLDAIGGVALCGAGLLMHRQPDRERALLVAAGLAELAVVAFSSSTPVSHPGSRSGFVGRMLGADEVSPNQVGYPPLDVPKPVADNVLVVDSTMSGALGMVLPVRMTVLRLGNGDLLLHSPTRYDEALGRRLEALGRIRHIVAPNVAHWTFLQGWQRAYPDATTWAAPGLRERGQVRRSGVRLDHDLGDAAPPAWGNEVETVTVPGGLGFREVALFHRPSRTLVLTDLVLNLEASKVPAAMRPLLRLFRVMAPDSMPPPYLRAIVKLRREDAAQAASRLLDLRPERVVFAHGRWFQRDGAAALRNSLRWLLDPSREAARVRAVPHDAGRPGHTGFRAEAST